MTDADASLRRLFVPEAQANDDRLEVEAREQTASGFVIRYGARKVTVIERQERHGHITHRQGAAARQVYRDYALGVAGARDRDAATGSSGTAGYADAQLDALRRYRTVRDRLGGRLWPLTYAVIVEDITVADFARHRGLNATATQTLLRLALDLAGDALGMD